MTVSSCDLGWRNTVVLVVLISGAHLSIVEAQNRKETDALKLCEKLYAQKTIMRSTAVVLNLFAEGSQIENCDFVREPH